MAAAHTQKKNMMASINTSTFCLEYIKSSSCVVWSVSSALTLVFALEQQCILDNSALLQRATSKLWA